jgi:ribosomal protein S27AE
MDTHPQVFRLILRAFQDRRQNKGLDTLVVDSPSQVRINLDNFKVTVRSELKVALDEIDPPSAIHLIRECPECGCVFWAGRNDKTACDKHRGTIRKRKQRQDKQAEREKTKEQLYAEQKEQAIKTFSRTAIAVLDAIVIGGNRVFNKIDYAVWFALKDDGSGRRVPNPHIVRGTLNMLVRRGYLTHNERAGRPREDEYEPRQKLIDLW